jgi:small subunit ribosomal protein S2e
MSAPAAAPAERGERGGRGGRGGFKQGFGGRGGPRRGGDDKEWTPLTKLGRLVKSRKVKSLEEIYYHALPIKEGPIVDQLLEISDKKLSDEVMKIISVQKQTKAGQRTRFKAIIAIGDLEGHVGLGVKLAKEVQLAIKGALIDAKLNFIPVRRGYWGNKIGNVHTVPVKVTGKCGSVRVRLVPAPRGTGIVGAPVSKKLIQFAGVDDCYTSSQGKTRTVENFCKATFQALGFTYGFLTPDFWTKANFIATPYAKHTKFLETKPEFKARGERGDRPRGAGRGGPRGGRGRRGD